MRKADHRCWGCRGYRKARRSWRTGVVLLGIMEVSAVLNIWLLAAGNGMRFTAFLLVFIGAGIITQLSDTRRSRLLMDDYIRYCPKGHQ